MRTITAIAALTGTLMIPVWGFFQPVAHADSLSAKEYSFVTEYHSIGGVVGVVKGVMDQGFSAAEAVEITNVSVATYCPEHWKLLQDTGAYFRVQQKGRLV